MPALFLISALLHAYVGWRLLPDLPGPAAWAWAFGGMLAGSALLIPRALLARRRRTTGSAPLAAWAGLGAMGLFSSLFVLTLLRDAVLLLAAIIPSAVAAAASASSWRPSLAHLSAAAVPLTAAVVTVLGFLNARRTAAVVPVAVPVRGLPPALHGFSVAQISDIHVGPTIGQGYLQRIVDKVNRLNPDLVAITGDLVDGSVAQLGHHVAPLAELRARHGTFFVTGNHEYYSGAHAWIDALRSLGLTVLMNEHVVLRHRRDGHEAALVLAGVTDYSAHHFDKHHRSDPQAALAGAPADAGARVLLAHQPRSAPAAAAAGFDLQLSGHTHGGQFWPWNLFVRFQQPFTAGLHRLQDLWVYTSRGTGYWGPPKRFGAPSEITLLKLVPAS